MRAAVRLICESSPVGPASLSSASRPLSQSQLYRSAYRGEIGKDGRDVFHESAGARCITGGSTIIDERFWKFVQAQLSAKKVKLRESQRLELSRSWLSIKNAYAADQEDYKLFLCHKPVYDCGAKHKRKVVFPHGYLTVTRAEISQLFEESISRTVEEAVNMVKEVRERRPGPKSAPIEPLTIVLTGGLSMNPYFSEQIRARMSHVRKLKFERPPRPCTKAVAEGAVAASIDGFVTRCVRRSDAANIALLKLGRQLRVSFPIWHRGAAPFLRPARSRRV
jgi:hypothetical protein